jgi:hypothetical protein
MKKDIRANCAYEKLTDIMFKDIHAQKRLFPKGSTCSARRAYYRHGNGSEAKKVADQELINEYLRANS